MESRSKFPPLSSCLALRRATNPTWQSCPPTRGAAEPKTGSGAPDHPASVVIGQLVGFDARGVPWWRSPSSSATASGRPGPSWPWGTRTSAARSPYPSRGATPASPW